MQQEVNEDGGGSTGGKTDIKVTPYIKIEKVSPQNDILFSFTNI